jgi:CheY-like chemotaxis protein
MAQASEHRHTVLLIDDNDDLREAFVLLTATMNLDAVALSSGHAGLESLRDGLRPCLILLDLSMPDMDGFAFRREQLKDPQLARIPTAVVSGVSSLMQTDARTLGLTTFLRKPVDVNELMQLFVDHCGAQPRAAR